VYGTCRANVIAGSMQQLVTASSACATTAAAASLLLPLLLRLWDNKVAMADPPTRMIRWTNIVTGARRIIMKYERKVI
jgi:hypothetical protein